MSEYKVLVIDDSCERARAIETLIGQLEASHSYAVSTCVNLSEIGALFSKGYVPHIVLMDLSFAVDESREGRQDAVEAAERLLLDHPGVQLIYMCEQGQQTSRLYRTEHVYCLTRPVEEEELRAALAKAESRIRADATRPLGIKVGGRIVRITPSDIDYIESDRRKVRIYANGESIEAYESLSGLAARLPSSFYQCHKSFLVNMDKIAEFRGEGVTLTSGATVPISQKRGRQTRAAFSEYLRGRLM